MTARSFGAPLSAMLTSAFLTMAVSTSAQATALPLIVSATGAAGKDGPVGPTGPAGRDGTNGTNGVSVTSTALPIGDPNCPNGGSSFASASGTMYACNGTTPAAEGWHMVGGNREPSFAGWTGTYLAQ